jgi:hypothetical protein
MEMPTGQWLFTFSNPKMFRLNQKFRLIRDKDSDRVLEEFMGPGDESTGQKTNHDSSFPIWKRLPGTEQEKLPFGQVVPGYQSLDLPLQPVL